MTDRDDDRLAALFRDAAGDPPPGFDHDAVVTRSRRVTARRRSAVLGAAAALVVVLGTGAVVAGLPQQDATSSAAPAAGSAERDGAGQGRAGEESAGEESALDGAARPAPYLAPDTAALAPAAPLGPGTTPCVDRQDPALRALLDTALPEVAGAPEAAVTQECREGGAREVNLEVTDGAAAGLLTVGYVPAGGPLLAFRDGAVATAPTASGGTVVVRSAGGGPGGPDPFAERLDAVAAALAPAL